MPSLGPTAGWVLEHGKSVHVDVEDEGALRITGEGRTYLVNDYRQRGWGNHRYMRFDLSDPLTFTLDLSRVPCGCVASVYLVRMRDPSTGKSNYCDAAARLVPGLGGEMCVELDVIEANAHALQSAVHTEIGGTMGSKRCDRFGCFARIDHTSYGDDGSVIDTRSPFEVRAEVHADGEMKVTLEQGELKIVSFDKSKGGNPQGSGIPPTALTATAGAMGKVALAASLWSNKETWLDGEACTCNVEEASFVLRDLMVHHYYPPSPPPSPSPPIPRHPPLVCADPLVCKGWCSIQFQKDHCGSGCACKACDMCQSSPPPPRPPFVPPPSPSPSYPPLGPPPPPPPHPSPPQPTLPAWPLDHAPPAPPSPPPPPKLPAPLSHGASVGGSHLVFASADSAVERVTAYLGVSEFAAVAGMAASATAMLALVGFCLLRVLRRPTSSFGKTKFDRVGADDIEFVDDGFGEEEEEGEAEGEETVEQSIDMHLERMARSTLGQPSRCGCADWD